MKNVIFGLLLSLASLTAFGQAYTVTVSGLVTDESTGNPVPNQPMTVMATGEQGMPYQNVVYTDSTGYYEDSFSTTVSDSLSVSTPSCDETLVLAGFYSASNPNVTIDFNICTDPSQGGNDCEADFWYYIDSLDVMTIHFVDASAGNPLSWYWSFDDGTYSVEQNPVHTYTEPGEYQVSLYINSDSCSDMTQQYIYVGDSVPGCHAMFLAHIQDGPDFDFLTWQFIDISIGINGNPPDSWSWDFGDGSYSNEQNPVHTFPGFGIYEVCFTISDSAGNCTDTYCEEIEVYDWFEDCWAEFTYYQVDSSSNQGLEYQFIDRSIGDIETWYWDFDDGTTSTEQNPVHTFPDYGLYQVCLTIANPADSCSSTFCQLVSVQNDSTGGDCLAWFTHTPDDSAGINTVIFEGFTTIPNPDSFLWNFGDGSTGSGQTVSHTFDESGMYQVTLVVQESSCVATQSEVIWVGDSASFSLSGYVFFPDEDSTAADDATVYLMTFDTLNFDLIAVDETQIDNDLGHFEFNVTGLQQCIYFIQAELNQGSAYYGNYVPTYHLDAVNWEEADPVFPTWPAGTYSIIMQPAAGATPGTGTISGTVNSNESRGVLADVEILLLDENNVPLAYTRTDSDGNFSFENLGYGTYIIYTEVAGINTIPGQVTLDSDHSDAEVTVLIANGEAVMGLNENSAFIGSIGTVYPNPAENAANIDLTMAGNSSLKVEIINSYGQVLQNKNINLSTGSHRLHLSLEGLSKGIYFIKIIPQDNASVLRKFVKIK